MASARSKRQAFQDREALAAVGAMPREEQLALPVRTVVGIDPGAQPTMCAVTGTHERNLLAVKFYEGDMLAAVDKIPGRVTTRSFEVNGERVNMDRMPVPRLLKTALHQANPELVVNEDVWVRPGQGIVTQGRLVAASWLIHGVAYASYPTIRIYPKTWRLTMGCDLPREPSARHLPNHQKADLKHQSRARAASICPSMAGFFERVKDHNRAEAFLMALFGLRCLIAFDGDWIHALHAFGVGCKHRIHVLDEATDRAELRPLPITTSQTYRNKKRQETEYDPLLA